MKKLTMKLLFTVALLLPINANAFFFSDMINGMTQVTTTMVQGATSTTNNAIDAGENTASDMMSTVSKLSDDIGTMANRILTMADKIGEMADRIGDMSDRIVKTEEMMFNLANNMSGNGDSGCISSDGAVLTSADETVILSVSQTRIWSNQLPDIHVNTDNDSILLFVSSSIFNDNSTSVMLSTYNDLEKFWPLLKEAAIDNKLYIAVKTINGSKVSAMSNTVELTFY